MNNTKTTTKSIALLLGLALSASAASITVVAPTPTTNGSLTISEDLIFSVTSNVINSGINFVMDEWVTGDGGSNGSFLSPDLAISINGGAVSLPAFIIDNPNSFNTWPDITANDGWFGHPDPLNFLIGDVITLKSGSYTLQSDSGLLGFNSQSNQVFTGTMFITNGSAVRVSNIVALPEPSSALLLGGSLAGLLIRRRRTN